MKLNIYQIYYKDEQVEKLDKDFMAFDNRINRRPEWCEYGIFLENYLKGVHKEADYTGFISWKFYEKTEISGATFKKFILENPGYDVYFFNPFPEMSYFFKNVWHQAEFYHPGILSFTQQMFNKIGYQVDLNSFRNTSKTFAFCNYWVGNTFFWDRYMNFTRSIHEYIEHKLSKEEHAFIYSKADKVINANYIPFIMERLFSTLLAANGGIKALTFPNPKEITMIRIGRLLNEDKQKLFKSNESLFKNKIFRFFLLFWIKSINLKNRFLTLL